MTGGKKLWSPDFNLVSFSARVRPLKPGRIELAEVDRRLFAGREIGDELAGDGGEGESHHGVAGGDDEVLVIWSEAEVGEAIG